MRRSAVEFDDFYAARAARLVRNIYTRTGDLGRAEECVQEAFVLAWRRWARLSGDDPVAWVTTVAWRLAIKDWRRAERDRAAWQVVERRQEAPGSLVELKDLLAGLPRREADVLALYYLEDFSVRQVAETLEISEGTVKSDLSRGRQKLRATIEKGGMLDDERV